jgi:hypothetical protein
MRFSRSKRKHTRRRSERAVAACAGATPRGPWRDPRLSVDAFFSVRASMPLSADMFGICRRGDLPTRSMGGSMDGTGARLPLPPLRRLRVRSTAGETSRRRKLGDALALWRLAYREVDPRPAKPAAYLSRRHKSIQASSISRRSSRYGERPSALGRLDRRSSSSAAVRRSTRSFPPR